MEIDKFNKIFYCTTGQFLIIITKMNSNKHLYNSNDKNNLSTFKLFLSLGRGGSRKTVAFGNLFKNASFDRLF